MQGRLSAGIAIVIALGVAACGGGTADTTLAGAGDQTTTASAPPDTTTTTTALDPFDLETLLAGLDADPATAHPVAPEDRLGGTPDYGAATAITAEVEAAIGASLTGIVEFWVFPVLGSDEIALVADITADEESDVPETLIEALVGADSVADAGVTLLVMLVSGTDEQGAYTITVAVPWHAARTAVLDGADVTSLVGVQLTRDGRAVDR